jgi:hypothetical protein
MINNNIGKMETAPRKPWITGAAINKMKERRKPKPQTSKNIKAQ